VKNPTPYPELNAILHELVTSAQAILGGNFISAYLQGSFAAGDFDMYSDVDFLVAMDHEVSATDLPALQTMHARIYHLESSWATHLEGSYFPKEILKSGDLARTALLYLDNTQDHLIRSDHDNSLVVRWVVREHGITLAGPPPDELVDRVSADDLRQEVLAVMHDWAEDINAGRWQMNNRWAQPFAVLSYCRMLHTLQTGRVCSKPAGARWAMDALDKRWTGLIQRAWDERPDPGLKVRQNADPEDLKSTTEFINYALGISRKYENIQR
jgi:predicted nucleotidyltransferase